MSRLIYWIFNSLINRKNCGRCCLNCKYYDTCRKDS